MVCISYSGQWNKDILDANKQQISTFHAQLMIIDFVLQTGD